MSSRVRVTLRISNHIFIGNQAHYTLMSYWKAYPGQLPSIPMSLRSAPKWRQCMWMYKTGISSGHIPTAGSGLWVFRDNRRLSYRDSRANPFRLGYLKKPQKLAKPEGYPSAKTVVSQYIRATQVKKGLNNSWNPQHDDGLDVILEGASSPTPSKKGPPKVGIWA